ncbi:RNA binding S1 domain protein [Anaerococcus prevotii DSM 20548]|uniref:RNA binding S1 domain protein n=2 Tax=Anaerococcus prevotii TaxID=33034 RepID=C7RHF3_ANAPD|nr:RNA binding S1 domain protein [Anaerococcus prevotii DSM 20548]
MIKEFTIKRFSKNKAYLKTKLGDAVIDKKYVKDMRVNDKVSAVIYHDRNQVLRAAVDFPYEIGSIHSLKAVDIDKKGVYFEIENNQNIFMPFTERTYKIIMDMTYPVAFKEDRNAYVYLTSKIRDLLRNDHSYEENDEVSGRIYSINKSIGAFIAVDNKYDSLLRIVELRGVHIEGELIEARVKEVKDDGKLELSLRQRAYLQMDDDSDKILDYLYENDGIAYFSDKSSPDNIYRVFNMSKSAFKRALGRLYKNNDIIIYKDRIELKEDKYDRR